MGKKKQQTCLPGLEWPKPPAPVQTTKLPFRATIVSSSRAYEVALRALGQARAFSSRLNRVRRSPSLAAIVVFVVALTGCGSNSAPDDSVKRDLLQGISQIRGTHDYEKLRPRVARTITRLRQDRAPTDAVRRAKDLAIQGFGSTLRGVDSEIDFVENDRGEIRAATRDSERATRSLKRGAKLLRAAGRILDVRVGTINGL